MISDEECRYSSLHLQKFSPAGWTHAETRGERENCLAYIDDHCTDIRLLSFTERASRNSNHSRAFEEAFYNCIYPAP